MKKPLTSQQKNVFKVMDNMIDFFIQNRGEKPPRLALDSKSYRVFMEYQRLQQKGHTFLLSDTELSKYRDVEIYQVQNGSG